jgi:hypothetical protein
MTPMREMFRVLPMLRLMTAVLAAVAVLGFAGAAVAQDVVKQIALTEKQMEGFIAGHEEIQAIIEKNPLRPGARPNPRVVAELDAAAKKHGFTAFVEYEDVAANIGLTLTAIDPQTKQTVDPQTVIRAEIARIQADRSIPAADKRRALADLNEALKTARPIQFLSNIELVKKYYDKLAEIVGPGAEPPPPPPPGPGSKKKK